MELQWTGDGTGTKRELSFMYPSHRRFQLKHGALGGSGHSKAALHEVPGEMFQWGTEKS